MTSTSLKEQSGLIKYLMLPKEKTDFELQHVVKINQIALWACAAHIPLFLVVAWLCDTSLLQAALLGAMLFLGPYVASKTLKNPRALSLVFGFTSMCLGAVLVHLGKGPMQIEMHFHFFASLALLTVWGNPLIIWTATLTVAVHHLLFGIFIPKSVFNYEANFWVVLVHALFVVVEAIAASYIARNFYDNVIGLDKIVKLKTVEVDKKNKEMRLILNNTTQGFMVINLDGTISGEKSSILEKWFGENINSTNDYREYLNKINKDFSDLTQFGLNEMKEDLLPMSYYLESLPSKLVLNNANNEESVFRFEYTQVSDQKDSFLVVVNNITEELRKEQEMKRQLEIINVFNFIAKDKSGFEDFMRDADKIINQVMKQDPEKNKKEVAILIHTLKGNAGVFQLDSVAKICHTIENNMAEHSGVIQQKDLDYLSLSWNSIKSQLNKYLTSSIVDVDVTKEELSQALLLIENNAPKQKISEVLKSWEYEPAKKRLERLALQAKATALRVLGCEIEVECIHNNARLNKDKYNGFWIVFNHMIRNSIDHGIASLPENVKATRKAKLTLETKVNNGRIEISIMDNGAGINKSAVLQSAGVHGSDFNNEKLLEVLCRDGFSTKGTVTEISGRGVGLSAVKKYCEENDFIMEFTTKEGEFTQFKFSTSDLATFSKAS